MTLPGWGRKVLLLAIIPVPPNACKAVSEPIYVPEDNLTIKYKNQHTYSQSAYAAHNCVSNVLHMLEEGHLPEKYIIALATGIGRSRWFPDLDRVMFRNSQIISSWTTEMQIICLHSSQMSGFLNMTRF